MSDNFNIQAFVQKTRNADLKALQEGYDNVPGETATALMNTPNTVQAVEQVIRILKEMNVESTFVFVGFTAKGISPNDFTNSKE